MRSQKPVVFLGERPAGCAAIKSPVHPCGLLPVEKSNPTCAVAPQSGTQISIIPHSLKGRRDAPGRFWIEVERRVGAVLLESRDCRAGDWRAFLKRFDDGEASAFNQTREDEERGRGIEGT